MKNYYDILGVKEDEKVENIEKAYKAVISKYNPDNFKGEAKDLVKKRIEEAKEAYSILSDDYLRQQYDNEIGIQSSITKEFEKRPPKKRIMQDIEKEIEEEENERKEAKKKSKKSKVGTARGLMEVVNAIYESIPKGKPQKPTKKGILSLLAAIIIVILIGVILWFIPATNQFMRNFLLIG